MFWEFIRYAKILSKEAHQTLLKGTTYTSATNRNLKSTQGPNDLRPTLLREARKDQVLPSSRLALVQCNRDGLGAASTRLCELN